MVTLILLLVIIVVGALFLQFLPKRDLQFLPKRKGERYRLKPSILTPAELRFWETLKGVIPENTLVAFKPRLADIFEAETTGDRKSWRTAFNRINAKHVDFLLITPEGKPLLGIELDDISHQRAARNKRDEFVNAVFAVAGLPILHIKARNSYENLELKKTIETSTGE